MMQPQPSLTTMPLTDLFQQCPQLAEVFQRHQMVCAGCPVVAFCTVADAIAAYDLSPESFLAELQRVAGGCLCNSQGTQST